MLEFIAHQWIQVAVKLTGVIIVPCVLPQVCDVSANFNPQWPEI